MKITKVKFNLRLKEERTQIGSLDRVMFEWAKLKKDTYVVYIPKLFNKEPGGTCMILNEKKIMKWLENHKRKIDLIT